MLSTPKAKAELFLASSLYDGLEDNNIMQVTTLLLNKEADPNVLIPSQGITPFHLVIGNDSETFAEEVTKLFLRHGGNPNVKSVDGMTPVHVAAAWGRLGVLELLLSNGGDPLLVDDEGRSPFHYAFDEAHYDAVATLGKYCGESFEEDSHPKYNIALDKILVSNGGVVAEYAVSEDSFATAASDVPAICTSKVANNNEALLKNLNKQFGSLVKAENPASEWHARHPANNDITITTTADESSTSASNFVNVRRHRRCLPRKNPEYVKCKLENADKFKRVVQVSPKKNLPVCDNRPSISHLNDPVIEASFLVEPRKVGENMPRISSPKSNEKLLKSERGNAIEYRNVKSPKTTPRDNKKATGAKKFVHKTPLRCSKKGPLVELKKTPTSLSAKKISNLNDRTTPNNRKFSSNDNRALIRTPSRYISKQISYSPDCSIVSKSPNLIRTPITPTNNYRLQEERKKVCVGSAGTPSKTFKRTPLYGSSYKTPTPDKICNNKKSEKNFSRFVKQSDLRHQGTKKTPTFSPSEFRESPTWSKKCTRTPNLTDSTKQKKKFSTAKTKTTLTASYATARLPTTPLNKTYCKNEYLKTANFSPDIETNNRFVDRRTFAKNIAIKLEETMYDDDCDKRITSTDVERMQGGTKNTINSGSSIAVEHGISNVADNRLNHINERINSNYLTSNKCIQISGVNTITDSTEASEYRASDIHSSQSCSDGRGSNILAGFFQPSNSDGSSVRTSDDYGILNNAISPRISKPCPITLASNFLRPGHPMNPTTGPMNREVNRMGNCDDVMALAASSKRPNSKEIDDSLVSSEPSSYSLDNDTRDPKGSMYFGDTGVSIEQGELRKNGAAHGNDEVKSEFLLPRLSEENYPVDSRMTCSVFPNVSSSIDSSSYASFVSVEEEYKYEDAEEGIILLERRLLITLVSIPMMVKPENGVQPPSEKSSENLDDESMASCVSSLPHSLVIMDSETLRKELTKLDSHPPGPITATTRHLYLRRLRKLQKHGPAPQSSTVSISLRFSAEIERTLRSDSWMNDLSPYETLEQQVFREFSKPDPTRRWREGTTKSSFNYLLMDPRITDNLPRRADALSSIERWRIFLSSIFYVGKGRRSRPYAHLYEAYGEWKKGAGDTGNKKVDCILDIWKSNCGVVCLHFFQNTIPVEAYTREAAMIETLGLDRLKNCKLGEYYGVAATWSHQQKRTLGVYLLYKAMNILINEGERQLSPDDIGR